MRVLFILLIWALVSSDILGKEFSIAPGLSAKNVMLYLIAFTLFFRTALGGGGLRMRLPILHAAFAVWIFYAALSLMTCWLVIHYASYSVLHSGMGLKVELIDPALFCFTVFYGMQGEADFKMLIRTLAAAIGVSSVLTLADVAGVTNLGVRVGTSGAEADRVFGVFGHANETGALLVCLVPMLFAVAAASRGPARLAWFTGAVASLAVLVLTVSRGAFVGLALGYGSACFICRRYFQLSRLASWLMSGITVAIVLSLLVGVAMPDVGAVLADRLFGSSFHDVNDATSGRTDYWLAHLGYMMDKPLTLLTGFGWYVQETRFLFATHNYYLLLWFDLGLIGVGAFLVILHQCITTARRAADVASPEMRRYMIAFVFGMLALAVSVFFTNLGKPWPYIWIYVGLTMNAAARILAGGQLHPVAAPVATPQPPLLAAAYGRETRARRPSATGAS